MDATRSIGIAGLVSGLNAGLTGVGGDFDGTGTSALTAATSGDYVYSVYDQNSTAWFSMRPGSDIGDVLSTFPSSYVQY